MMMIVKAPDVLQVIKYLAVFLTTNFLLKMYKDFKSILCYSIQRNQQTTEQQKLCYVFPYNRHKHRTQHSYYMSHNFEANYILAVT